MDDPTFPVGTDVLALVEGYELHKAATTSGRFRNIPATTLSEAQVAQRRAIIDINYRLLINARDKAFDEFAVSWIRARGIQV